MKKFLEFDWMDNIPEWLCWIFLIVVWIPIVLLFLAVCIAIKIGVLGVFVFLVYKVFLFLLGVF